MASPRSSFDHSGVWVLHIQPHQVPVETHASLNVLDHEHIEDFATFTVPSLVGRTSSISHLDCLRRAEARISPQASIRFR